MHMWRCFDTVDPSNPANNNNLLHFCRNRLTHCLKEPKWISFSNQKLSTHIVRNFIKLCVVYFYRWVLNSISSPSGSGAAVSLCTLNSRRGVWLAAAPLKALKKGGEEAVNLYVALWH